MAEDADRRWVESMPDAYERWLVPTVFAPFAADLAARLAARAPSGRVPRVLELAAGTGVLTRELASLTAPVEAVATDLNEAMVGCGRRLVPQAEWQQADAMDLPFDDATFDFVACQFGVMFFPDKVRAFAEARRVLAPGGRLLANVWGWLEDHTFQHALVRALARVLPAAPTFMSAVVHGYADPQRALSDLQAAGFEDGSVRGVTLEGTATSVAGVAVGYCTGTPLRAGIEAQADLAATTAAVAREMESLLGPGPVTASMTAHVLAARAPRGPRPNAVIMALKTSQRRDHASKPVATP